MQSFPSAAAWLDPLNDQQREAVTWGRPADGRGVESGPLLVIAGAGTGKTSTLAHRVAFLVVQGVDPQRILLMTFSRRAAQEMTHRAGRLVAQALASRRGVPAAPGASLKLPWAGTFHAIGARVLRLHADELGLDPDFGLIDRGDSADLMDIVRQQSGLAATHKRFPRKDTCLAIYSLCVNSGEPLERVLDEQFPWCGDWADALRALFARYVERKQQQRLLDYDDLLLWWDLAMAEPAIAARIGARFDHVLVDEYQDTNRLQARILRALKPDGRGLTVVGDDAQSIYAFRAADVDNILRFPDEFDPPAHRVTLSINYRSVQPVLDVANALLAEAVRQYPKTLIAHRSIGAAGGAGDGGDEEGTDAGGVASGDTPIASRESAARPRLVTVLDEHAQACRVADEVLRRRECGIALRKQAVLFRNAHHSDLLEVELMRRDIPFVKYGGLKFLEAAHVKDLLGVLRWADNPRHGLAAFRTLQLLDGMGPVNAQRCLDHLGDGGFAALATYVPPPAARAAFASLRTLLIALSAPGARWDGQVDAVRAWYLPILQQRHDDAGVRAADLDMLATVATQFGTRERFLTELTLDPPSASGDLAGPPLRDEDYLILSTVHSAKGQEWDSVYLLHVADGTYPNEFATSRPSAIEEERRLLYVALTRARNQLELIEPQRYYVTQQARHGPTYVTGARSRFLTPAVMACLDRPGREHVDALRATVARASSATGDPRGARAIEGDASSDLASIRRSGAAVSDVAARIRRMW